MVLRSASQISSARMCVCARDLLKALWFDGLCGESLPAPFLCTPPLRFIDQGRSGWYMPAMPSHSVVSITTLGTVSTMLSHGLTHSYLLRTSRSVVAVLSLHRTPPLSSAEGGCPSRVVGTRCDPHAACSVPVCPGPAGPSAFNAASG